ncbi:uncharacterized protein [Nicotiana tomentosiformis]|uniref:uncharacterized protein n=1 Tax=Nicotiana tomentosiformis TaxID=4098 RepID=UPI00388C507D
MYQQLSKPLYPSYGPSSSNNEIGRIENMLKQMMEKNADSDAQIASHNTSIRSLEIQMEKISQALNSHTKGALPSDTVVNPKGGNNTEHAMTVTTRSGRGWNASTSSQRQLVDDEKVIDIDDSVEETQEEVNPSRDQIIDISELVVQKAKAPLLKPLPPYPQRLAKQNGENQFKKFIQMMKSLSINVPLVEAWEQMLGYEKFMKDLMTKKRLMNNDTIKVTHQVSAIVHSMAPKLEDPGAFTIPCTIGNAKFEKALCDLGAMTSVIVDDPNAMINVGDMLEAVFLNFDDDDMDGFM